MSSANKTFFWRKYKISRDRKSHRKVTWKLLGRLAAGTSRSGFQRAPAQDGGRRVGVERRRAGRRERGRQSGRGRLEGEPPAPASPPPPPPPPSGASLVHPSRASTVLCPMCLTCASVCSVWRRRSSRWSLLAPPGDKCASPTPSSCRRPRLFTCQRKYKWPSPNKGRTLVSCGGKLFPHNWLMQHMLVDKSVEKQ